MRTRRDVVAAASFIALTLATFAAGAQEPTASPSAMPAVGAVQGVVFDSLGRRPLAGATVQVVPLVQGAQGPQAGDASLGRSAVADAAGAFRIDSLLAGRYVIGFVHPLLDRLRVEATPRVVAVGEGGATVRVTLSVPPLPRVRAVVCGAASAPVDSAGLLVGRVRDAATDAPLANARVVLTWSEAVLGAKGVQTERHRVSATTGPTGGYVFCDVPAGEELRVTAEAPRRASGDVGVEMPPGGFVVRDLAVGDTSARASTARLTGTVRDPAGRPIRGAQALVWGAPVTAASAEDGTFTLAGLPAGTHTLEVRAIGFTARWVPVDLAAGRAGTVAVAMERAATKLTPMTVFGTPNRTPLFDEFLARRRTNAFGRFLTEADIERVHPYEVTDALRGLPGLQLVPNGRLGKTLFGRSTKGGSCRASVVVDGYLLDAGDTIERLASVQDVAGIEIYLDPTFAPPQYAGPLASTCSVVLVWSKGR